MKSQWALVMPLVDIPETFPLALLKALCDDDNDTGGGDSDDERRRRDALPLDSVLCTRLTTKPLWFQKI